MSLSQSGPKSSGFTACGDILTEVEREGRFRRRGVEGPGKGPYFPVNYSGSKGVQLFRLLCIVYCFCGREKTPDQSSLRKEGGLPWLMVWGCSPSWWGRHGYRNETAAHTHTREVESRMLMLSHFPVFIQSPARRILPHTFRVSLLSAVHPV